MFLSNTVIIYLLLFILFIFIFLLRQESSNILQKDNFGYKKIKKSTYIIFGLILSIFSIATIENINNKNNFEKEYPQIVKEINNEQ